MSESEDWAGLRDAIDAAFGPLDDDLYGALLAIENSEVRIDAFWWAEPDQDDLCQLNAGIRGDAAAVCIPDPEREGSLVQRCAPDELSRAVVGLLPPAPAARDVVRSFDFDALTAGLRRRGMRTALGGVQVSAGPYGSAVTGIGLTLTWVDLVDGGRYCVDPRRGGPPVRADGDDLADLIDSMVRRVRAGEGHDLGR